MIGLASKMNGTIEQFVVCRLRLADTFYYFIDASTGHVLGNIAHDCTCRARIGFAFCLVRTPSKCQYCKLVFDALRTLAIRFVPAPLSAR